MKLPQVGAIPMKTLRMALMLLMLATVGCQALEQGVREENVDASEAAYDDGNAPDGPSN